MFSIVSCNQALQRDEFILTIGFDFGTSCSKIIVNAPYVVSIICISRPGLLQMDDILIFGRGFEPENYPNGYHFRQLRVLANYPI